VPVRRRTLYGITLFTAAATVPTLACVLLIYFGGDPTQESPTLFALAAFLTGGLALNGLRIILQHDIELYWEEARFIWPAGLVIILLAIWLGCEFCYDIYSDGYWYLALPWLFGSPPALLVLYCWMTVGQAPRRSGKLRDGPPSGADTPSIHPPAEPSKSGEDESKETP
jgi:hypothetical protein